MSRPPIRFTLEIELGNEAMQTPADVGGLLAQLSDSLLVHGDEPWGAVALPPLRDLNGSTVGKWGIHDD